jgi:uncharacterized protein (TIGR03435 family)
MFCAIASVIPICCQPGFDVASIKPGALARAGGEGSLKESIQFSPQTLTMRNVSLSTCMQWGYRVKDYQISGPAWTGSERYDVFAKTGAPVNESDLRRMLRVLLTERFKLEFHRDRKEVAVYALERGKEEPRLKQSTPESESGWNLVRPGLRIAFRHQTMGQLADLLSTLIVIGRPVVDRTGLDGAYDFLLDLRELQPEGASEPGPSPSSVVSDQLGLRLEARKAPLEILVIDRAEREPIAN